MHQGGLKLYDESVETQLGVSDLWLCGHFTAKSFAFLLHLLSEKRTGIEQKRLLFWQTKSAVQPLGPHDEWSAFEIQRRSSTALAKWAVVGGVGGTGHPKQMGNTDIEHEVANPEEYRSLMTPLAFANTPETSEL